MVGGFALSLWSILFEKLIWLQYWTLITDSYLIVIWTTHKQHYLLITPRVSLCSFKVTPNFGEMSTSMFLQWKCSHIGHSMHLRPLWLGLISILFFNFWFIHKSGELFLEIIHFTLKKDVFPSFSQLCFTNLVRPCHKKSLPQIRESPLLNQESQILAGKEGKGGWKCLKHVQATYLTLNFMIPCDCHIRVATLMPSTLHFGWSTTFTTCTCQFE